MITKVAFSLLTATFLLFTLGVSTGNHELLLVATVPFYALLIGAGQPLPEPSITRDLRAARPVGAPSHGSGAVGLLRTRAGDKVTVTFRVTCPPGRALVELHQPLPPVFDLERGSNVRVVETGRGASDREVSFTFRCTKRGKYLLAPATYEVIHPMGLAGSRVGTAGGAIELEVSPRIARIRRVRAPSGVAKRFFPENDLARMGAQTTEFREIRDYAWGDPPRTINWKATARRLTAASMTGGTRPMVPQVNEYEREGKKSVFLFVDAGNSNLVGSSVENALESHLEAATSVAQYFLDRGYRLGAYVYNARNEEPLYPDSGRQQFRRITDRLVHVEPAQSTEGLDKAVQRCRGHLVTGKPMIVVVSRVAHPLDSLSKGVRTLRALTGRQRRKLPVIVVNPVPYHLMPDRSPYSEEARAILERADRAAASELKTLGVGVLTWNPRRTPFAAAWLRGRVQ